MPWLKGDSEPHRIIHYAFRFINDYSSRLQVLVRWKPYRIASVCQWKWNIPQPSSPKASIGD
ncbi:MAG: hypothetical protein V1897_16155, partial [Pseudomonadota bacterium]